MSKWDLTLVVPLLRQGSFLGFSLAPVGFALHCPDFQIGQDSYGNWWLVRFSLKSSGISGDTCTTTAPNLTSTSSPTVPSIVPTKTRRVAGSQ